MAVQRQFSDLPSADCYINARVLLNHSLFLTQPTVFFPISITQSPAMQMFPQTKYKKMSLWYNIKLVGFAYSLLYMKGCEEE